MTISFTIFGSFCDKHSHFYQATLFQEISDIVWQSGECICVEEWSREDRRPVLDGSVQNLGSNPQSSPLCQTGFHF